MEFQNSAARTHRKVSRQHSKNSLDEITIVSSFQITIQNEQLFETWISIST